MILAEGLGLPESPRWRDGRLVFSDVWGQRVIAIGEDGAATVLATLPDHPSGLGWTADGRLLIVLMRERQIVAWDRGGVHNLVDLSAVSADMLNELIVHPAGHAYVGDFAFPIDGAPRSSGLFCIDSATPPAVTRVAEGLFAPNGMAITPDGRTLIVAESAANRLTAFTIATDGTLHDRRLWAALDFVPDGICLTESGAIWVATPRPPTGYRLIVEGGALLDFKPCDGGQAAFACVLGGGDRRTFFGCEAPWPTDPEDRGGRIVSSRHDRPGAGLP